MSLSLPATTVNDTVHELVHKLQLRDVAVQQLKERCELMQEDFEHNYRLVQQQANELQVLRVKVSTQERVVKQLEARTAAQAVKLREADQEVQRQTQSLTSTVESLRAQLLVTQTEHGNLQRKYGEKELEVAALRQDLHHQSGQMSRNSETIRREAIMESETLIKEKERVLRLKEEQWIRDSQSIEQRCLELNSELHRVKELKDTADIRIEELTKLVARKEFLVQQAQEQLNEVKKHHAQQLHKIELEAQGTVVMKDQLERTTASQLLAVQREVERRAHDSELLEQKLTAVRQQHELELKRKTDERDEVVRGLEDRLRVASERIRVAEAKESELQAEMERERRRTIEGRKAHTTLATTTTLLEDRIDELQRVVAAKDTELGRMKLEVQRLMAHADRKEKEAEELRGEFERRSWQDRVASEIDMERKRLEWRKVGAMKQQPHTTDAPSSQQKGNNNHVVDASSSSNNQWNTSMYDVHTAPSPIVQQQQQQQAQYFGNSSQQQQQQQQQQRSQMMMGPPPPSSSSLSSASFLQELTLLREQHHLEKANLERRLEDAQRVASRNRSKRSKQHTNNLLSLDEEEEDPISSSPYSATSASAVRRRPDHHDTEDASGYASSPDETTDDAVAKENTLHHTSASSGMKNSGRGILKSSSSRNTIYAASPVKKRVQHHHHDHSTASDDHHLNHSVDRGSSVPPLAPPSSSAMSRVEQLQRQLAASPLATPLRNSASGENKK